MTKYDILHELTKLVLACRPENMLLRGAAPMMEDVFQVSAEAHAFLVHQSEDLKKMYGDNAKHILVALEYEEILSGKEAGADDSLPLKIRYALELIRDHGIYARTEEGAKA